MRKRTYRTVSVQQVDVEKLSNELGLDSRCVVAIDIAKKKMVAGISDGQPGGRHQLVRFDHPKETREFLSLLEKLEERGHKLEAVMEPTGVYGDSLRYQLGLRQVPVFRVDGKRVHDAAEMLDGVPSMHDAKACTLIAHLHVNNLSKPWRERTPVERALRCLVDERELYAKPFEACCGQLEALVSRHWPELSEHLDYQRAWHLHLLVQMPSPAEIATETTQAAELLRKCSRGKLSPERIEILLGLADDSLGTPMEQGERDLLQALVRQMLMLRDNVAAVDGRIEAAMDASKGHQQLRTLLGVVTTAVILADLGDPAQYGSCAAVEKAAGLNLKIQASGNKTGERSLHITKRGPSRVRRYLFLAALRLLQKDPIVTRWYHARTSYQGGLKLKAVVAVMRKLTRALPHVSRGEPFDASKLFDTRKLPAPALPTPAEDPSDRIPQPSATPGAATIVPSSAVC